MKCCAPDKDSKLVVRAAACCHIGPVTATLTAEVTQSPRTGEAGKPLGQVLAQNLAQDASMDAILARNDNGVLPPNHRDSVPTYLLGCSLLR